MSDLTNEADISVGRCYALTNELLAERRRQVEKFGNQNEVPCLDPVLTNREGGCHSIRMCEEYEVPTEVRAKAKCDTAFGRGQGTHAHIVVEELCEAISAPTKAERRKELVQLATTVLSWIEAIDSGKQ